MDHAAVGPLPQPARDAIVAALDAQCTDGCRGILEVESKLEAARALTARQIHASADEIAFMRSTSDGALLVANGLDWQPGDEVIFADDEFGANAYPWLNLRDRGVRPVLVRAPGERVTPANLERVATSKTRVVAVSYVGFSDGYRNDLRALGAWCRAHGVLFAVDAIQGFGRLPLDVAAWNIDVCYSGVAKWLLSPQGLSIVFVRREVAERLRPALASWRSVREPMRFLDYAQPLADGARRFDAATINYPAAVAYHESLTLLANAGFDALEAHAARLESRLIEGADRAGLTLVSPRDARARSGIAVIGLSGRPIERLARRALDLGVQVTIRDSGVRISPHGYNTEDEVDRALEIFA